MLREQVLDHAIAIAKSRSHAEVLPAHVVMAAIEVLSDEDLDGVSLDRGAACAALPADGTAIDPPVVTDAASAILASITDVGSAVAVARGVDLPAAAPTDGAHGSAAVSVVADEASIAEVAHELEEAPASDPAEASATLEALLAQLDALIGLAGVKAEVRRLVAVQRANLDRRSRGMPEVSASYHLVFTGAAGTGKTTVARILAQIFGVLGIVSEGHLVEVTRSDLVAGYVGQTATRVEQVVRRAIGGVLFIDEAYALALDSEHGFGAEALATLVKLMEDHRDDLVVIVAGYEREMRELIAANSGLRSRFARFIAFPDYSVDELIAIFHATALAAGVASGPELDDGLRAIIGPAAFEEGFGNARFVRTLFEESYANLATRALADGVISDGELDGLAPEDLPLPRGGAALAPRRIGFGAS